MKKIKWLKTKREEANRMKEFNFLRSIDSHSAESFYTQLQHIFAFVNDFCYTLERMKQLPELKGLWSAPIKKDTLDKFKEDDRSDGSLFSSILECRKDFIEFFVNGFIGRNAALMEGAIAKFGERIAELTASAYKNLEEATEEVEAGPAETSEQTTEYHDLATSDKVFDDSQPPKREPSTTSAQKVSHDVTKNTNTPT